MDKTNQQGKVFFIGAGPGAPDLITLRGRDIIAHADLILYADSLVQESIATTHTRNPNARIVGSSGLHLEQIVALMVETARAGGVVARLHTGDPALYGAVQEQIAGLDAAHIAWDIVPGVTAAFAAAARLGASFTLPDVTQTLIISRIAGRTPVPKSEELRALAAHGASLVLYLSVAQIEHVVALALASGGYTPQTPVTVVHHVTWHNEHITTGTLADIVPQVHAAGYTRHALIIISPTLAQCSPHQHHTTSKLYNNKFSHGFRTATTVPDSDKTEDSNKDDVIIIAMTDAGSHLASRLAPHLNAHVACPARFATQHRMPYDGSVADEIRRAWMRYHTLILIMASGIAVRAIAPLLAHKTQDPAIICMDEQGRSIIPLIGGHRAGANDMARRLAAITSGHAAITTASDVQGKPALDLLGQQHGWKIYPDSAVTHASACIVNNETIGIFLEPALQSLQPTLQQWLASASEQCVFVDTLHDLAAPRYAAALIITHRQQDEASRHLLHKSILYHPPVIAVGIGCHAGTPITTLQRALDTALAAEGLAIESVATLATIPSKANETGIHQLAKRLGVSLHTIDETEVRAIDTTQLSSPSAAYDKLGLPGVAEPCAILAAGGTPLLAPRHIGENCTVALALRPAIQGNLALVSIGPGALEHMTIAARNAIHTADVVIGYRPYITLVQPLLRATQAVEAGAMRQEVQRAEHAIALAQQGQRVALISSGDVGIYGMAGAVFDVLRQHGWHGNNPPIETFPGVSAFQAAAACAGAPINHDTCIISLSDLLTDWAVIEQRLWAAAHGDCVLALYNPRSRTRDWQLARARDILLTSRPATTPVALVHHATRPDETICHTTLAALDPTLADMNTIVLVGNSYTVTIGGKMATPRGYHQHETQHMPHDTIVPARTALPITLTHIARAIVIGGGTVGERKVRGLLAAHIFVQLISPSATPQLQAWAAEGHIEWQQRTYQPTDIAHIPPPNTGVLLLYAATNQRDVNKQIAHAAAQRNMLCNIADAPDEGTFHVPAVHRNNDVAKHEIIVAVSTGGANPALAASMCNAIAQMIR